MATTVIDIYVVGNTLPAFQLNWAEGDVDISGWTITLRMRRTDDSLFTKTAVITDGPAGDFEFQWTAGDLLEGHQPVEINFDTGSGNFTVRSIVFKVHGGI